MARNYTVADLITRLDDEVDISGDTHVVQAEKIRYLDTAYARLWTKIAKTSPPDHFIKDVSFNTVAGTKAYSIATIASDGDFWQLKNVYVNEGDGQFRPLPPVNEFNVQAYRAPQVAQAMQLSYIKCAPKLTATNQTIDGVQGWEELMVMYACEDICRKKKDDPRMYREKIVSLERDIEYCGHRDVGWAETIVRKRNLDPFYLYHNNVDGYRLRGDNLELFYRSGYLTVP